MYKHTDLESSENGQGKQLHVWVGETTYFQQLKWLGKESESVVSTWNVGMPCQRPITIDIVVLVQLQLYTAEFL